jgi:hypothetical protein
MKAESADIINEALICDDYEFTSHNARGRYIGTVVAKRPQWLKDNPGKWRSIKEIRERAARLANPNDGTARGQPGSSLPDPDNFENGLAGASTAAPTGASPPPKLPIAATERQTTTALSLSAIAESAATFNGQPYVNTQQFASMAEVSDRQLYRQLKAEWPTPPTPLKVAGCYYKLDEALKWIAERRRSQSRQIASGHKTISADPRRERRLLFSTPLRQEPHLSSNKPLGRP